MKIHVDIIDDNGEILSTHDADATTPSSWNAPPNQRFVSKMPQNSDNVNNGTYELFRITFQPITRVDRPNGYVTPPPAPSFTKQSVPWGPTSPTNQQATFAPASSLLGSMPTRG